MPPTDHLQTAARNIVLLKEAAELSDKCTRAGVRIIFTKGVALLTSVYSSNPGRRKIGDIDVLVRPNDLEKVIAILERGKYSQVKSGEYHFASPPGRKGPGIVFDLHESLPHLKKNAYMRLWKRAEKHRTPQGDITVLGLADEFVYLIQHAAVQHGELNPIWMTDIDLLLKKKIDNNSEDISAIGGRIRNLNLGLPSAVILRHLREEYSTPVPAEILNVIGAASGGLKAGIYRKLVEGKRQWTLGHVLKFFTMKWYDAVFGVERFMFPPSDFMRRRYGVSGPWAVMLMYIYRPFEGAFKLMSLLRRVIRRG